MEGSALRLGEEMEGNEQNEKEAGQEVASIRSQTAPIHILSFRGRAIDTCNTLVITFCMVEWV